MADIIKVNALNKSFGTIQAVNALNFSVQQGEVYGFLGQNGAGKSTTIRMLLTLVSPDSGSMELFGLTLAKHKKEILRQTGAVIERPDLYKYLTAYDNLLLFARLSGMKPTRKLLMDQLEMVGLASRAFSKVKTYSQGMKQRLGIAIALIHNPGLIILDEPTNGLDPQGIADIRNLILDLSRNQGKTVLVSSHLLSEIEMIADRMLIMDKGEKIMEGAVTSLLDPSSMRVQVVLENQDMLLPLIQGSEWGAALVETSSNSLLFKIDQKGIPELTSFLVQQGGKVSKIQAKHSLEDYFLSLTTANQHVHDFKH